MWSRWSCCAVVGRCRRPRNCPARPLREVGYRRLQCLRQCLQLLSASTWLPLARSSVRVLARVLCCPIWAPYPPLSWRTPVSEGGLVSLVGCLLAVLAVTVEVFRQLSGHLYVSWSGGPVVLLVVRRDVRVVGRDAGLVGLCSCGMGWFRRTPLSVGCADEQGIRAGGSPFASWYDIASMLWQCGPVDEV